jgi:hypothetical protein
MTKNTSAPLTMVSAPKRVKKEKDKDKDVKPVEDKQYDLRPDWMKPGFIQKKEENKDNNTDDIKRFEDHLDNDYGDYYEEDDDIYYKELYYERLNNILSKYDPEDYESRYYAKIYFELQQLDEEIHPWNYY